MTATTFGAELRRYRERAKISLRKLAAVLEISPPYLSDIERGHRAPLTPERQVVAFKALDLSLNERNHLAELAAEQRLAGLDIDKLLTTIVDRLGAAKAKARLDKAIAMRAKR